MADEAPKVTTVARDKTAANTPEIQELIDAYSKFQHDGMLVVARSVEALRHYCTRMARAQLDFADAVVAKRVGVRHVQRVIELARYERTFAMIVAGDLPVTARAAALAEEEDIAIVAVLHPEDVGREVRPVLKPRKRKYKPEHVPCVPLHGGALAIAPRPTRKNMVALVASGVTAVVTLLCKKEAPRDVRNLCRANNVEWIWVPLEGAKSGKMAKARNRLARGVLTILAALAEGHHVAVHCAASIHRTGTVSYAVARAAGLSQEDAREFLWQLRPVTARGVGDERLEIGEEFAVKALELIESNAGVESEIEPPLSADGEAGPLTSSGDDDVDGGDPDVGEGGSDRPGTSEAAAPAADLAS